MALSQRMEENDAETLFKLHARILEEEFTLQYQIVEDVDELLKCIKNSNVSLIALIVLDQAIKSDFEAGGRAFTEIEKIDKRLAENTIFLTAYPGATCTQLRWSVDDPRLVAKPPETAKILRRFVSGLARLVSPAARVALTTEIENGE